MIQRQSHYSTPESIWINRRSLVLFQKTLKDRNRKKLEDVDKESMEMENLNSVSQVDWEILTDVVLEAKQKHKSKKLPFTYYYWKSGILVGSFFCGEEEGEFVLFFNLDYREPALMLELIAKHCQILNEEILVYPLKKEGIKLYETLAPKSYKNIEF